MGHRKLKPPWTLLYEISDGSAAVAREQVLSNWSLEGSWKEDEEKLKVRTIQFGEKTNEVRRKMKVVHKIMPNTAKVSLMLRFPFLTIQERAWQPGTVPPPSQEQHSWGGTGAAPAPGSGHLSGDGPGHESTLAGLMARQGRATESCRPALLRHCWGRGWQRLGSWAMGRVEGIPMGLTWGPGPWAGWREPRGVSRDRKAH